MFCPKCAAQNSDGTSYCRVCGANISMIPQALSGELQQTQEDEKNDAGLCGTRRPGRGEPSLEAAFKSMAMGIAFLLVAIALAFTRMGTGWWFWMFIPAFMFIGTGLAQYLRHKERGQRALQGNSMQQPSFQPQQHVQSFPTRATGELVSPPPSVTEGTTRHLGAEAPTRHLEK